MTIVLKNPNATAAKMTAPLVDELPAGLTVYGDSTNTCGGTLTAVVGSKSVTLTGGTIPVNSSCAISVRVTVGKTAGKYVNKLGVGTLKTTKGNNESAASGTLTVSASANTGPTLSKSFSPASIKKGQNSTLTITLKNAVSSAAKLTAPFTDHLPKGMVVAGAGSSSCGGTVTAVKGSSSVTLTGGSIPAKGTCKITVPVTAPCANYWNQIAIGALQTSNGSNKQTYGAALTVTLN